MFTFKELQVGHFDYTVDIFYLMALNGQNIPINLNINVKLSKTGRDIIKA